MRPFLLLLALGVAAPSAWSAEVLTFTQGQTPRQMNEIATAIRSVADVPTLAVDREAATLTLDGPTPVVEAGVWIFRQLDRPTADAPRLRAHTVPDLPQPALRVFYWPTPLADQALSEIATLVRSVGKAHRLFTYTKAAALVVRHDEATVHLVEWLVEEMQQGRGDTLSPRRIIQAGDAAQIFYLSRSESTQRLRELAVEVRRKTSPGVLIASETLHAFAVRGTPEALNAVADIFRARPR